MPEWAISLLAMLGTVVCSIVGSTGLWHFLEQRANKNDARNDMLRGLGHDAIMRRGIKYIERGNITADEFENLYEYLYKPYAALNGNGSAKKIMEDVKRLPVVPSTYKRPISYSESAKDSIK